MRTPEHALTTYDAETLWARWVDRWNGDLTEAEVIVHPVPSVAEAFAVSEPLPAPLKEVWRLAAVSWSPACEQRRRGSVSASVRRARRIATPSCIAESSLRFRRAGNGAHEAPPPGSGLNSIRLSQHQSRRTAPRRFSSLESRKLGRGCRSP